MSKKSDIMEQYDKRNNIYLQFAKDIENLLKRILKDEGISYNAITCRLKDRGSLSKKIDRKNDKYGDLSEITDIAGIRVITYYVDDVDKVANIVEREFDVDKENSIDKGKALEPDRFGYCSVHYIVGMDSRRLNLQEYKAYAGLKCEIQIRSVLQHAWAEIEHDTGYKSEVVVPRDIRRNFSRLAGLLEIADKEFQEIRQKIESYRDEVENRIEEETFADTEIDGVLIETLINTNSDIIEMNNDIIACFNQNTVFREDDSFDSEFIIGLLNYFEIHTLGQLLKSIEEHKEFAVNIARNVIESGEEETEITQLSRTIAIFYLCYAEILSRSTGFDAVLDYLKEYHISDKNETEEDVADKLLEIKEKYLEEKN